MHASNFTRPLLALVLFSVLSCLAGPRPVAAQCPCPGGCSCPAGVGVSVYAGASYYPPAALPSGPVWVGSYTSGGSCMGSYYPPTFGSSGNYAGVSEYRYGLLGRRRAYAATSGSYSYGTPAYYPQPTYSSPPPTVIRSYGYGSDCPTGTCPRRQ